MMTIDTRAAFIASLREAADFLEAHPRIAKPCPVTLYIFAGTKEQLLEQVQGASWQKDYMDKYLAFRHAFKQDVELAIYVEREKVCRRVVTGTHVVPEHTVEDVVWECEEAVLR